VGMRYRRASIVTVLSAVVVLMSVAGTSAIAADEATYLLPAPEGTALVVAQGNRHPTGRTNDERYAFDFVAAENPERFAVLAARGGTVIGSRAGVRGGRCTDPVDGRRPDCWRDVNYVVIDHGDGTSGLYLHLKRGKPMVRRGEVVSMGQRIGTAGTSGWTHEVGLQFQLQDTPVWSDRGTRGWFQTASLPVAFADADVVAQRADGVPRTDDLILSDNPGATFDPFRFRPRPRSLPASVPFEAGAEREISRAYDADSPDGYGLHFAPAVEAPIDDPSLPAPDASTDPDEQPLTDPGTVVRPLFGGELAFAGCASGNSASLGRTVAISLEIDETPYLAVLGGLSDIEPALLDLDPEAPALIIGPNDTLGHYGVISPPEQAPVLECPEADPRDGELFAAILRDATITTEGEIIGGTPVSPEPLVGARGYEGFAWWPGPLAAAELLDEPGRPRSNWNKKTPAHASHIPFGETVRLTARVRDITDIAEVRFRAYYPRWPRVRASAELQSFDSKQTWRELAVCTPPGEPGGSRCQWNGDAQDALVTFRWDPTETETTDIEPSLPRARTAMTRSMDSCVPVSVAVEVVDRAGHVHSDIADLPLPSSCDQRAIDQGNGRVLYLDPLVPPAAPTSRGKVRDRGWPPVYSPDPLDGAIVWRDRSSNEDGFRIYARRSWFEVDCTITNGPWQLVTTLPADTTRHRPNHGKVRRSIEVPEIPDVPGFMSRWEYAVASFNEVGASKLVPVGGFRGSDAFCDPGLEPPPDL